MICFYDYKFLKYQLNISSTYIHYAVKKSVDKLRDYFETIEVVILE